MKTTLRVFSWIAVVLGALAFFSGIGEIAVQDPNAVYSLFGGSLFLTQGILSLVYIEQTSKA